MADRKRKKKIKQVKLPVLIATAAVACAVAAGVTLAYMFKKTPAVTNNIVAANVACEVTETYANNVKSSIAVTNTGNVPSYMRVKLVSYWQDKDGNVVGKPSPKLSVSVNEADGWTIFGEGSDAFYYYSKPVKAEEATPTLITKNIELETDSWVDENGDSITVYQVVDVFAEAIQSEPASAVTEAWGVTITSD